MKGKGRKEQCGSRDEQVGVGGWDGLPLQQQSQLKVFIKLKPLFLGVLQNHIFLLPPKGSRPSTATCSPSMGSRPSMATHLPLTGY